MWFLSQYKYGLLKALLECVVTTFVFGMLTSSVLTGVAFVAKVLPFLPSVFVRCLVSSFPLSFFSAAVTSSKSPNSDLSLLVYKFDKVSKLGSAPSMLLYLIRDNVLHGVATAQEK